MGGRGDVLGEHTKQRHWPLVCMDSARSLEELICAPSRRVGAVPAARVHVTVVGVTCCPVHTLESC